MPEIASFHYSYLPWMEYDPQQMYKRLPEVEFPDFEKYDPKQVFADQIKRDHYCFRGKNINEAAIFYLGEQRYEDYITIKTIFCNIRSKNIAKAVMAQEYLGMILIKLKDKRFCEKIAPVLGYYFQSLINHYLDFLKSPGKVDPGSVWVPSALEMWFGIHFAYPLLRKETYEQNHFIVKMAQLCKLDLTQIGEPDFAGVCRLLENYTTALEEVNIKDIRKHEYETRDVVPFDLRAWACTVPTIERTVVHNGQEIHCKELNIEKYVQGNFLSRIEDRNVLNPQFNMITQEKEQEITQEKEQETIPLQITVYPEQVSNNVQTLPLELEQKCEEGKGERDEREDIQSVIENDILLDLNRIEFQRGQQTLFGDPLPENRKRSRSEFLQGQEEGMGIPLPKTKAIKINREDWSGSCRDKTEQETDDTNVRPDYFQELLDSGISSEELLLAYFAQQNLDRVPQGMFDEYRNDRPGGSPVLNPRFGQEKQEHPEQLEEKVQEDEPLRNRVPFENDPMDDRFEDDSGRESKE